MLNYKQKKHQSTKRYLSLFLNKKKKQ